MQAPPGQRETVPGNPAEARRALRNAAVYGRLEDSGGGAFRDDRSL